MNAVDAELFQERSFLRRGSETGIALKARNPRRRLRSVTTPRWPQSIALPSKKALANSQSMKESAVAELDDSPHYVVHQDLEMNVICLIEGCVTAYRGPNGYEGDLLEAVNQIELLGDKAWPSLSKIASIPFPELEYFLGAIVNMSGVRLEDRMLALLKATHNNSPNVRSRLLELADELPARERLRLIKEIASSTFDDDVTDRASDKLRDLIA